VVVSSLRFAQHMAASDGEMDEGRRPSSPTDAAMGSLDPSTMSRSDEAKNQITIAALHVAGRAGVVSAAGCAAEGYLPPHGAANL
jgi:hypothetical protein